VIARTTEISRVRASKQFAPHIQMLRRVVVTLGKLGSAVRPCPLSWRMEFSVGTGQVLPDADKMNRWFRLKSHRAAA